MKIRYVFKKFKPTTLAVIRRANEVIEEFQAQGLVLTVRQLYYQFVSRGWLPNRQTAYDNLQNTVTEARLAGLIDWDAIEDRTRNLKSASHWDNPADIVQACARQFRVDRWATQPKRVEVWIEKEALAGVLEAPCSDLDVPFFACRGYTSASEMWAASQRLIRYIDSGQKVVIIHLGDHDPSGVDMTRDIFDRLDIFLKHQAAEMSVDRIALNMDQVKQYNPPPNPAKTTDCRFESYRVLYGDESWELDALNPSTLVALVRLKVESYMDAKLMKKEKAREQTDRDRLAAVGEHWEKAAKVAEKARASVLKRKIKKGK